MKLKKGKPARSVGLAPARKKSVAESGFSGDGSYLRISFLCSARSECGGLQGAESA